MMDGSEDAELVFYRAVEDLFATLRGRPHLLSPKDFQLLREWWRDGVPLAAVTAGLTEVVTRRRDAGEADPVVSLSYCRHAVKRQHERLHAMRVGEPDHARPPDLEIAASARALSATLAQRADANRAARPLAADVIAAVGHQISAAADLPPAALEDLLFTLEGVILEACAHALGADEAARLEAEARTSATSSGATGEAFERAVAARRDRLLRELLGLPRLELR